MTNTTDTTHRNDLATFLSGHSLSGDKVAATLKEFGVNSLYELKTTKEDPEIYRLLKEKFAGQPIVSRALDMLTVEAIDNAIFYASNAGAEANADKLLDFLEAQDVLAGGAGRDKLFSILRGSGISSLEGLRAIKERDPADSKLKGLQTRLLAWDKDAASAFAAITAAAVTSTIRGRTTQASPELKAYLQEKRLPADTDKDLAELGITTLEELKDVKQDKAPGGRMDQLKAKLDSLGNPSTAKQLEAIKTSDLDEAIATAGTPTVTAKEATERSAKLAEAIGKVEALRKKVRDSADAEFKAVKTDVDAQFKAAVDVIGTISGADFGDAATAATANKTELDTLLKTTISNATAVKEMLDGVDKTTRPIAKILKQQEMLCGFLITPHEATAKYSELVKLPADADKMSRDPGPHKDFSYKHKGSETKSFAASSAQHASSTLAAAAEASGGGFVGSGVAAVAAAASYADAKRESTESQTFDSSTTAECGEVRYVYVPKQVIQFDRRDLRLGEGAQERLGKIAQLTGPEQQAEAASFFDEFGSHFFLRCSLGGRYQFTAKGRSDTETGKGTLVNAVAQTTKWATAASASYAGIGGAATAAASVEGQSSVAAARGDRFALSFDNAEVTVTTHVLGGAGLAPRDVWAQSLNYNSTWAVIDREQPIAVWEILDLDSSVAADVKALRPVLEEAWVRTKFLDAIRQSQPVLHKYIKAHTELATCAALTAAVEDQHKEPALSIVVAMATSSSAEHPKVTASATGKGLKLIGGGAIVDYGGGPGSLLTGSHPDDDGWVAASKSHVESSPATVTAYAIYLSDPDDLWDVAMVSARTTARSNRPEVTARLPAGYALTGGGALVDWSGPGMLLTACCPERDGQRYAGWTVRAKDHEQGDAGNATAWVFGIRPRNGVEPAPSNVRTLTDRAQHPALESGAPSPDEVIVGGGAAVTYTGPGGLLTANGLSSGVGTPQQWKAQAKDHHLAEAVDLKMWVITRPGTVRSS